MKRLSEIGFVFFKLGLIGFGGPAAHIAMMQNMISGVQKKLSSEGLNSLDGIMDKFGDNELVDKYKKKLGL